MSKNLSYPFAIIACVCLTACTDKTKPTKPIELPPAQKALMQAKQSYDKAQKAEVALDFKGAKAHYQAAQGALDVKQSPKDLATITTESADQPWNATTIKTTHLPRVEKKLQMSRDTLGWIEAEIEKEDGGQADDYRRLVQAFINSKDLPNAKAHLKKYDAQLSAADRDMLQSSIKSSENMRKLLNSEASVARIMGTFNTNQTTFSKYTFEFAKVFHTQSLDKALAYLSGVKDPAYKSRLYAQAVQTIQRNPQLKSHEDKQRLVFAFLTTLSEVEMNFKQTNQAYQLFRSHQSLGFKSAHDMAMAINKMCDASPLSHAVLKAKYFAVGSMDGDKHKETRQKHVLLLGENLLKLHEQKKVVDKSLYKDIVVRLGATPTEASLAMIDKIESVAPKKQAITRSKILSQIALKKPYNLQPLTTLKFAHLSSAKDNKLGDIKPDVATLKTIHTVGSALHEHKQIRPIKALSLAVEESLKKHQRVAKTFKSDPNYKTIVAKHHETLANLYALQDDHGEVIAHIKPVITYLEGQKDPDFPDIGSVDKITWKKVRTKQAKQIDNLLLQLVVFDRYNYRFNWMFKRWVGHKLAKKDVKTIKTRLDQNPKPDKKLGTLNELARVYGELPKEAQSSEMTTYLLELLSAIKAEPMLMPSTHFMVGMCKKLNCLDRLYTVLLNKNMNSFSQQVMLSSWAIYKHPKAIDTYIAKLPDEGTRIMLQVESLSWRLKYGGQQWKDVQKDIEPLYKRSLSVKNASRILGDIMDLYAERDRCHELFDFLTAKQLDEKAFNRAAERCAKRQTNTAHDYPEYTAKLIMGAPASERIPLLLRWIGSRGVIATPALQTTLKPYAAKRIGL